MEFEKVCRLAELRERRGKLVNVGGEEIALWRVDGKVYAINNVCPHQHFSMLHQGTLSGVYLTCPMHGWTFSLIDGMPKTGNGKAKIHRVKVEGDEVFVEMPSGRW